MGNERIDRQDGPEEAPNPKAAADQLPPRGRPTPHPEQFAEFDERTSMTSEAEGADNRERLERAPRPDEG